MISAAFYCHKGGRHPRSQLSLDSSSPLYLRTYPP
jgi:hypothetical protein